MNSFNVLDRNVQVHRNYLLEASAGTGKTFSIQNIVVRLLIEESQKQINPFSLEEILVVTFTKAATRDLRLRIRSNIEKALGLLNKWECGQNQEDIPDYLLAILEQKKEVINRAKKRLQYALYTFDSAQIFTIHSFCARMMKNYALECDIGIHSDISENSFSGTEIIQIVRDFFRTEIRKENYSPAQIGIFLKKDPQQKKLLKAIQSGYECADSCSFEILFQKFSIEMMWLKKRFGLNKEDMIKDFKAQYELYKNYNVGETKNESLLMERLIYFFPSVFLHLFY